MLQVQNVSYQIHQKKILQDITMNVKEGEVVALCGPNGAGKSTLLRAISGEITSTTGNIYVNEILFFSGVRPAKKLKKLKNIEIEKIIKFSKSIISKAIILGGSSIKNFSSSSGKKGSFQQHLSVYGKEGENCPKFKKCNGKIKKIVIDNRASFFCNKCQK